MDHIILGLLFLQGRTLYQLRARIRKGMDLMYSSSTGSIQAALKKLLAGGEIRCEEAFERGRSKKIYFITESGRARFLEWVNGPFALQGTKNPELVKVYFMGFSDRASRGANLKAYVVHLTEKYRTLNAICEEAEGIKVTEENREILFYQLAAARYGRDFMKFNIEWYQKLIGETEGDN